MSDPARTGACALLWSFGDGSGLGGNTGEDLVLLLLELTESMGWKDAELVE